MTELLLDLKKEIQDAIEEFYRNGEQGSDQGEIIKYAIVPVDMYKKYNMNSGWFYLMRAFIRNINNSYKQNSFVVYDDFKSAMFEIADKFNIKQDCHVVMFAQKTSSGYIKILKNFNENPKDLDKYLLLL